MSDRGSGEPLTAASLVPADPGGDAWLLRVTLGPGCYATVLVEELLRPA